MSVLPALCWMMVLASITPGEMKIDEMPAEPPPLARVVDSLILQLGAERYDVRERAGDALRRIGPGATPALEEAAQSDDPEIRIRAGEILKDVRLGVGPDWPPELVLLVRHYDRLDVMERETALRRLSRELKADAVPFLLSRISAGDQREGRTAVQCLQGINVPRAWERVLERLRDPSDPNERHALEWAKSRMLQREAEARHREEVARKEREIARQGGPVPESKLRVKIEVTVKDDRMKELIGALRGAAGMLKMEVKPFGFRLFDDAPASIGYDPQARKLRVLLNDVPCGPAVSIEPKAGAMRVAVRTLDCIYIFEIDAAAGGTRTLERFELDYRVALQPGKELKSYRDVTVTINEKPHDWQGLLEGVSFDYLPKEMNIAVTGATPSGERVASNFRIPLREPDIQSILFPKVPTGPTDR